MKNEPLAANPTTSARTVYSVVRAIHNVTRLVARVHAALAATLAQPAPRSKLLAQGLVPVANTPTEFAA